MKSTTPVTASAAISDFILKAVYIIAGVATLYFITTRALPYYNISYAKAEYGAKAVFIIVHVTLGIAATVIGPFQFIDSFRNKNIKRHRLLGKIYLLCTIISACISWYLVLPQDNAHATLSYKAGLFFLGFAWIASAIMAYLSVKNKKIALHKEWMVRSYVITLAFVTYRLVQDLLVAMDFKGTNDMMAWASWAVPLFITEIILQGRKIYK